MFLHGAYFKQAIISEDLVQIRRATSTQGKLFDERYDIYKGMTIRGVYTFPAIQEGAASLWFLLPDITVKMLG